MKRVLSIILSVLIAASFFSYSSTMVFANDNTDPFILAQPLHGKAVCSTTARFVKSKNYPYSKTQKKGKRITLSRGQKFTILGKEKMGGSYAYINIVSNKTNYYGYIPKYNVCVNNSTLFKARYTTKYNPYYKKEISYKYYLHRGLPFYQFNQRHKTGSINGLRLGYSCGPHSLAGALSALNGDVIFPETIMKHMSKNAPNSRGTGSKVSLVASSTKEYIKNTYHLNYEYKVISPYDSFDYLKKGYMVILGLENRDGLNLFTNWSHYVLLVDYDRFGNILTTNSNLQTALFDAFSAGRIKTNIRNQQFYYDNTLAIKYDYDNQYDALEKELRSEILVDTTVTQHYCGMGKYYNLSKGRKISILGKRGSKYYISFKYKGKTKYGFVSSEHTDNTVIIKCKTPELVYNGDEQMPKIKLKNALNDEIPKEDYEIIYPETSVDVGTYKIKIKYKNEKLLGKKVFRYQILPRTPKVKSTEPKKTVITVRYNDSENLQAKEYVMECSLTKDFKTIHKRIKVNVSDEKATIKGLKKNTRYYIRTASLTVKDKTEYQSPYTRIYTVKTKN